MTPSQPTSSPRSLSWRFVPLRWTVLVFPSIAVVAPRAAAPVLAVMAVASILAHVRERRTWPRPFGNSRRINAVVPLGLFLAWALATVSWSLSGSHAFHVWLSLAAVAAIGLGTVGVVRDASPEERSVVGRSLVIGLCVGLAFLAFERLFGAPINYEIHALTHSLPMGLNRMKPSAILIALLTWPAAEALARWRGRGTAITLIGAGAAVVGSFGAISLLLCVGAGVLAYGLGTLFPRTTGWAITGLLVAIVLGAPFAARNIPDPMTVSNTYPAIPYTSLNRLYIWQFAGKAIMEKPVAGWGMDSSRAVVGYKVKTGAFVPTRSYAQKGGGALLPGESLKSYWMTFYRDHPLPLHPHDGALQIWLELGGIGAVLAAWFLWSGLSPLRGGERPPSPYAQALTASASAAALVNFGLWQGWWISTLFLIAIFAATVRERQVVS